MPRPARDLEAAPRRGWLIFAVVVLSLRGETEASALWQSTASASHTVSTATLAPPTSPAAAAGTCVPSWWDAVVVSWTSTASTWADGYLVKRATASGGPYSTVGTINGQSVHTYTDNFLPFNTTYYYVIQATKSNWRSAQTAEVQRKTRSSSCT